VPPTDCMPGGRSRLTVASPLSLNLSGVMGLVSMAVKPSIRAGVPAILISRRLLSSSSKFLAWFAKEAAKTGSTSTVFVLRISA